MTAKWPVSNGLVNLYRKILSPIFHAICGPAYGCRFVPSCSVYFGEALEKFGPLKGGGLGLWRICRCHPWSEAGFDPVPELKYEGKYGS